MRRILFMMLANIFRLPYMAFKVIQMSNHLDKYPKDVRYRYIRQFVRHANKGGRVKVDAHGVENIPKEGSFILFPNHQGMYDVLTMIESLETPISPISKIEVEHTWMLGRILRILGAEFMDREDVRQSLKVITNVANRVKAGECFVIFPEGTRSKLGNQMLPFKPGAFKSATMARVPIVPVALIDSFVPFDRPSVKRTTVQVHYLEPIPYEEYKDMKTPEIAELVQGRIRETIEKYDTARS